MAECEYDTEREPSLSVAQWREVMGLPAGCVLTLAQEQEIHEALLQADEDVALYAGWWPAPTVVCEEIPVAIRYGGCFFARAGASRWVTLRFGKVQAVEQVAFLRRDAGFDAQDMAGGCYGVTAGAICVIDGQYGSVELDNRAAGRCGCPADIDRVRIRYVSGDSGPLRFSRLLARYAGTLLCSPHLCGLDLRCDGWDSFTLTETTQTDEVQRTEDNDGDWKEVATSTAVATSKEQRLPQNPQDYQSPFGHHRPGVQLWRYLKARRRLRAYRW
ncbi:MAG: hypothetical protein KJZ93_31970 [Caldilineaceae bacterium]|nr:hypothetical protein [Caldilineaceae bacterium]